MEAVAGHVVVRLRAGGEELLAAEPVGPDQHRLRESSGSVPMAAGDLVTAYAGSDGRLQVVAIEPAEAVLTVFAPLSGVDAVALAALWQATGAGRTDVAGPFLLTVWPGVPMDAVATQLNSDEATGRGEWLLAAEAHERRGDAQSDVDLTLH